MISKKYIVVKISLKVIKIVRFDQVLQRARLFQKVTNAILEIPRKKCIFQKNNS
jgi:hypothetical protein